MRWSSTSILPTFERKSFGSGPVAFVRQFAVAQEIALEVADQEIVLHYALALLDEAGLIGTDSLLFKGGTALRKCVGLLLWEGEEAFRNWLDLVFVP